MPFNVVHDRIGDWLGKHAFFPRHSAWVFTLLVCICCAWFGYFKFMDLRPQGNHQWRQTDCLSITRNYYEENRPFLQTATHFLGRDGTGQTMSEFPLVYAGMAQLWRLTGPSERMYRWVVFAFLLGGMVAMMKSIELLTEHSIAAILLVLLFFTSPIVSWYGLNFLSDVPAMGLSLMGAYWAVRYIKTPKIGMALVSLLLFLLAGLLKASAALLPLVFCFLSAWHLVASPRSPESRRRLGGLIAFGALIGTWVCWYSYAASFNEQHNVGQFLVGILPVWRLDSGRIQEVMSDFAGGIFPQVFRPGVWTFTLGCLLYLVVRLKHVPKWPGRFALLSVGGCLGFILLFFDVFDNHDYYLLNMMPVFPVIWVTAFLTARNSDPGIFKSPILWMLLVAFWLHNGDYARRRMSSRYGGWMNSRHERLTKPLEDITPWLRSQGIRREDRFLVPGDSTINVSLYLADQKGWTDYADLSSPVTVDSFIRMGADHLMVLSNGLQGRDWLLEKFPDSVGMFGGVQVWRRNDNPD
jgi:hypothetical protein